MREERLKQWIEALRSGKYWQCQNRLRDKQTNTYCCLGVASDLCPDVEWVDGASGNYVSRSKIDYLGLTDSQIYDLINLNDMQKAPFSEIADYIEQEILPK